MTPEQRAQLRAAGRAKAAELPDLSSESARRIAEMIRVQINQYLATQR
jgi:hypothetical protein